MNVNYAKFQKSLIVEQFQGNYLKGTAPRFVHLEKFSLNFSSSLSVIRVNFLHPYPSLILYDLFISL